MFEKVAEEWVKENMDCCKTDNSVNQSIPYFDEEERCCAKSAFQDGAEFGYNKANEWHYNGVPENENDILCQIDKDIFVVGYFHQKNKQYYTTSGEWLETVIAWKEIVLPEQELQFD